MQVDLARPRPPRRAVVAAALGPPALFVAWSWPAVTEDPFAWAAAFAVAACLAVTAAALMSFDRTAALWVEMTALCWVFGGLAPRPWTPWTGLSDAAWVGLWLSLAWALVSYPGDAPIRRWLARLWWAVFLVTTGCAMVASESARQSPLWWASALVPLAVGLSVGTLLVVRVLGASSVHRTLLRPVVVTTVTAATMTWLLWLTAGDPRSGVDLVTWLAQCLLVASIPVSVAVVAARRRLDRVAVAGLLDELASPPTVAGVQAVLRTVLRDPSATVLIPLPGSAGGTQADGTTAEPPNSAARLVMQVVGAALSQDTAADTIALVHLDASLAIDLPRIEAAVVTCGPALANARLHEVNRIRLRELHQTRARVVAAALEERRRLGRNLHDGAQGALVGVSMQLSAIRSRVTDRNSMQVLDEARDQVRAALTDLRVLTQDLYPAGLAGEGLGAALEAALDEQQMDVTLHPPTDRYDADVETVAYLTVLDLLSGLGRHRHATSAQVSLTREGRDLVITIGHGTDPGDAEGPWLTAVADRLRAMGGDLRDSRCGRPGPAEIEARIPCE
ncbi:MAG TPA: histidine kinase [Nakamurella sp.]